MASQQPKVLLFDMGGVCVASPFQVILDYESSLGIPFGWINFSISKSAPNGSWHRLERGEITVDESFFRGFNRDLHDASLWNVFYENEQAKNPKLPRGIPPLPTLHGEWLFNEMMSKSHAPDPWMYPALQKLRKSGRYILGALSNTVIFPPSHQFHTPDFFKHPLRALFDVFISSAHVGVRKPDPRIYQLTVTMLDKFARDNASSPRGQLLEWQEGIRPRDIVFFDDIGENLRAAKRQGFQTFKVNLGKAHEAVEELERITGLNLAGGHPETSTKPPGSGPPAKI
ncbi:epoxide hydrolase [Drechmeria coniospora]|uniref:Epoxide hydrolase n=1 Tax=Drechmeria coniospora TaxID=98403 RepID=A0A151GLU1_DRECN|nr:epoxide hydrolase [Drechmeria coniospora]KYK58070.1 epoxide hydrolase [Drechmeria coniospora]ODA83094.1 hypothetical protein RJ55_01603 [Drechmeria coniospora]